ncbi:hypothetical protein ACP3TC_04860 [Winslowiella sp. 2C04]
MQVIGEVVRPENRVQATQGKVVKGSALLVVVNAQADALFQCAVTSP